MVDLRSFCNLYILDLLKVVGTTKTYSPNGGLMVRYHGRKLKNHLKQPTSYAFFNFGVLLASLIFTNE